MGVAETIAKNSIFNFFNLAVEALAAFFISIILTRHLGTEQYGLYALMMWFLSLATLVLNLGMTEMVKRFIGEAVGQKDMNTVKGLVRLSLIIRGSAVLLTSGLIIVLSGLLAKLFNVPADSTYFMLVAVLLLPYIMVLTFGGIFAGFQKFEYMAYASLTVNLLRLVMVIIMVLAGYGAREILIMYAAVWALGIPMGLFFLSRLIPLRDLLLPSHLDPQTRNDAIKYSLASIGIHGVDYFLWRQAEVMFLGAYRPVEEVGFYTLAHKIPTTTMHLIPYSIGRVLLPTVAEQYGKGDMEKVRAIYATSSRYLMLLSFPMAAGGIALAGPIINILYGSDYAPAILMMQIVFVPFALRGIIHSVSSIIYALKKPGFILKIGIILIILSIGLNLWLIPKYGAIGAIIATSFPRVIALPIYICFASRKIKMPWPLGDTARVIIASVIMGLLVFTLQHYLSDILGLCLGVPAGIIIYAAAILALGLVKPQDLNILKQTEKQIPKAFRKGYAAIINFIAKFVR
jgi:O-antigen/teichoic acid export membrane protein